MAVPLTSTRRTSAAPATFHRWPHSTTDASGISLRSARTTKARSSSSRPRKMTPPTRPRARMEATRTSTCVGGATTAVIAPVAYLHWVVHHVAQAFPQVVLAQPVAHQAVRHQAEVGIHPRYFNLHQRGECLDGHGVEVERLVNGRPGACAVTGQMPVAIAFRLLVGVLVCHDCGLRTDRPAGLARCCDAAVELARCRPHCRAGSRRPDSRPMAYLGTPETPDGRACTSPPR